MINGTSSESPGGGEIQFQYSRMIRARHAASVFHPALVTFGDHGLEVLFGGSGELLGELERGVGAARIAPGALRAPS